MKLPSILLSCALLSPIGMAVGCHSDTADSDLTSGDEGPAEQAGQDIDEAADEAADTADDAASDVDDKADEAKESIDESTE